MIKALLIDGDGVVLKPAKKMFSQRLKNEYGIEIPISFWKEVYPKIRLGKASLEKELKKRIKSWGWQKSVDELLDYWWTPQNNPNPPVLKILNKLRDKGVKCYLASDNNKYRADLLMKGDLGKHFDGGFFSCNLGYTKDEKEFYQVIFKETGLKPEEIIFIDDEKENVQMAKSVGINSVLYQSVNQLNKLLE